MEVQHSGLLLDITAHRRAFPRLSAGFAAARQQSQDKDAGQGGTNDTFHGFRFLSLSVASEYRGFL